ncbi:MAG: DNA methyltransferase [Anaerolineae bacterium]
MPPLAPELRRVLERAVIQARDAAEDGARAALTALGIDQPPGRVPPHLSGEQRHLRAGLLARKRSLHTEEHPDGVQPLVEEVAYEAWHRMLFARFLAETGLLMHPKHKVAVTLADCAELAAEEGESDAWALAARYASAMLPGIFRAADPSAQVRFTPERRARLERILADVPADVFTADDALGWVYQFWQTKKKDEVNASGRKIGGEDLPPVTQLFTEHYMVQFLLENSLGAWWAARHPDSPLLRDWAYLRFRDDGTPAAGTFPGWPDRAAEVTVMDPCCGSGHFLVAAFEMLRRMRMAEEGLTEAEAVARVLRENLFGLELDPRCTQIAVFALAFAAWKVVGYDRLPRPVINVACSGLPVQGQKEAWTRLAGDDVRLRTTLERLYDLFKDAPTLGSLINPADAPLQSRLFGADYADVAPLLDKLLAKTARDDPAAAVFGAGAEDAARAADLLARQYVLVATNVPYLARGRQDDILKDFCDNQYAVAKADLATVFIERCHAFCFPGGSYAVVTPQSWLLLGVFRHLRLEMLRGQTFDHVARLGASAFDTIAGHVVNVVLVILTSRTPAQDHLLTGIDATEPHNAAGKAQVLQTGALEVVPQLVMVDNPDARIATNIAPARSYLASYANAFKGLSTGDFGRFVRYFWEISRLGTDWSYLQGSVVESKAYHGREQVIFWEDGRGQLVKSPGAYIKGAQAWGKRGLSVSQMSSLSCTLYTGELFDENAAVIIPLDDDYRAAIWEFCRSREFAQAVRRIDQSVKVTNRTMLKVPFDLEYWQKVADEAGPLPEPHSDDPTQWLFKGHPIGSTAPLQVAVARLLGYRWPQGEWDNLERLEDDDGIVCLPAVAGERPAAERLQALLAAAYGDAWSPGILDRLLADVGYAGKTLSEWLRDTFFSQHCSLFHNRPFIWHIWDGRKDGFAALVNYHKLDTAALDKLSYTYLGQWIALQRHLRESGEAGADGRLVAALELQKKLIAIREGEPPYDIYVRWKPLHAQPIGWAPDLNDGVRLNIRPFVKAGILRSRFTINWNKDRGANPDGSERLNDLHLTNAEKRLKRHEAGVVS